VQDCLANNPQLSLLFSMREDYIASWIPTSPNCRTACARAIGWERLGYDGALEAVKKPAEGAGRPFAEGVAEALVDNLRRIRPLGCDSH